MTPFLAHDDIIRPYRPSDRAAIRDICCGTADLGEPLGPLFSDHELVADALTRYYTDIEPESCWVAETDGAIVGYVNGAISTRRYARHMAWRIMPAAALRAVCRGALCRAETWRLILAGFRNLRGQARRMRTGVATFPAHLHVNLIKPARGRGLGGRLLHTFLAHAASRAVPGVQATVRADNRPGRHFFEHAGFSQAGSFRTILPNQGGVHEREFIIYARPITP